MVLLEIQKNILESLDKLGLALIGISEDYRIAFFNNTAKNWFGINIEDICYKSLADQKGPCPDCKLPLVIKDGQAFHLEKKCRHGKILEMYSTPFKYSKDETIKLMLLKDITEQKKAVEEKIRLTKLESLELLAGGIAHDFNNMLTGLLGNLEIMRMKLEPDHPASKYLENAISVFERASKLSRQLLTFTKEGQPNFEVIDIEELVKSVVIFNLSGSNVKPYFEFDEDIWKIKGDKGQLGQVISNLVINAVHAMPAGGFLKVIAENVKEIDCCRCGSITNRFVKIDIKDNGIGIPENLLDKIFEPYFTTKKEGSGLGLAASYNIIRRHKGHICVESKPGEGTIFSIYLPALEKDLKEISTKRIFGLKTVKKCLSVLIMDDEEVIRELVSEVLGEAGFKVTQTDNGENAIKTYAKALKDKTPFDIVMLDLTVPGGMGGLEVAQKIREIDPKARLIVASGYVDGDVLSNYKKYGFSARLTKPFKIPELKKKVFQVLKD